MRKFFMYAFSTAGFSGWPCRIALVAVAILLTATVKVGGRDVSRDWIVLEDCHLIINPANDGDSFHVSAGNHEYIFRLYLVDAPETDEMTPRRLIEQAQYFGITVPQAIEVGRTAKEFTQKKLFGPFRVFTHMSDAMGRSKLERFYGFVQTKDGDLGEQLVRNGLARNYGFKAAPPGSRNSRPEVEKLQQFEEEAKQEKIGGWGVNADRLNAHAQRPAAFSMFVTEKNARARPLAPASIFSQVSATPSSSSSAASDGATGPKQSHTKEKIEAGQIDINKATEKELKMIPGIGAVIAGRIIAARPFRSADDLKMVNGIGDKKYAKVRPYFQ